jgi:hypothetical protein
LTLNEETRQETGSTIRREKLDTLDKIVILSFSEGSVFYSTLNEIRSKKHEARNRKKARKASQARKSKTADSVKRAVKPMHFSTS